MYLNRRVFVMSAGEPKPKNKKEVDERRKTGQFPMDY